MMKKKYNYLHTMRVRDYECDLQGIVNNANYLHYLEHSRHEYLLHLGLSFNEMHATGVDPVVVRADMRYKSSLRPEESFVVGIKVEKVGLRYLFSQDIYRLPDYRPVLQATVELSMLKNGRLRDVTCYDDKLLMPANLHLGDE